MILDKKIEKKKRLFDSAYDLFLKKGINDTSIQEIADNADVGKGTFYLYFKDKYDLEEQLIANKSEELFENALDKLYNTRIEKFEEQIIFILNYIIDVLSNQKKLLKLISKNLSYGIYNSNLNKKIDEANGIKDMFINGIKEHHIRLDNPEITLFMIIELASATCFNCILNSDPLSINEYKPYLYNTIKKMLVDKD